MLNRPEISAQLVPLMRRLTQAYAAALRPFGLKPVEAHIVAELLEAGPLKIGDLGDRLGLSGSTLTGALDRLESRERIRREPVPEDRRATRLVATDWAPRERAAFAAVFTDVETRFFAALSERQRAELCRLLTKVNNR